MFRPGGSDGWEEWEEDSTPMTPTMLARPARVVAIADTASPPPMAEPSTAAAVLDDALRDADARAGLTAPTDGAGEGAP